jgi:hypothetical protein
MSFREQVASDFAEVAAELGLTATIGDEDVVGVLTEADGTMSLALGGYDRSVTARFRFDPAAHDGFVPALKDAVTADGRNFYVGGINHGGSHGLVTLDLVT